MSATIMQTYKTEVVYRVGILDHFSMATPSPLHRTPSSVWFYNHFPLSVTQEFWTTFRWGRLCPQQCLLDRGPPYPLGGPRVDAIQQQGVNALTILDCRASLPPFWDHTGYFGLASLPAPFLDWAAAGADHTSSRPANFPTLPALSRKQETFTEMFRLDGNVYWSIEFHRDIVIRPAYYRNLNNWDR